MQQYLFGCFAENIRFWDNGKRIAKDKGVQREVKSEGNRRESPV